MSDPALDLAIVGGRVVLDDAVLPRDVGVRDGRIVALAEDLRGEAPVEVTALGRLVLPGVVDVHVHLNEPGHGGWEGVSHGTAALACGGTTTAAEMPHHASPPTLDLAALAAKRAAWEGRSAVDYGLWAGVVPDNLGELEGLAAHGVVGLKAYMVKPRSDEFAAVDDDTLLQAMRIAAAVGVPVAVHAEDGERCAALERALAGAGGTYADYLAARPAAAEIEAVGRALAMAHAAGCALHLVHLSTAEAVALVAEARARGTDVTCETCPHYLMWTAEDVERLGTAAKCAPPIRPAPAREQLWDALAAGEIDLVSSDHSPCPPADREGDFLRARAGINGAQTLLATLLSEGHHRRGLALPAIANRCGAVAAHRFGLAGKGMIAAGADADLAIVDLRARRRLAASDLLTRHPQSPYTGVVFTGRVLRTLVRGTTVALEGRPTGARPGRLLLGPAAAPAPAAAGA